MKILITENRLRELQIKWLNDHYGDCVLKAYPMGSMFENWVKYTKNGSIIFMYDKKNGVAMVEYGKIWRIFRDFFGMNDDQTYELLKKWLEDHYKLTINGITFGLL